MKEIREQVMWIPWEECPTWDIACAKTLRQEHACCAGRTIASCSDWGGVSVGMGEGGESGQTGLKHRWTEDHC